MPTAYAFEQALEHVYPGHPEHPDRMGGLRPLLLSVRASEIEFRPATRSEIALVHTPALIDSIAVACDQGEAIIDFAPTFVTSRSLECALRAAGGTLACMQLVLTGDAANAFSIVRPPGHHAEPDRAMGFCLFNNVAIAAAAALQSGLRRIAVVDFDAHHGNGTQAAFLNDPRVAYLSTHQWGIYPGSGWFEEAPHARSRIVNVPLPAMSGDIAYGRVAKEIIRPFIRRFRPELLLVSAGFDAHWNDPITSLGLSTAGFHLVSRMLVDLADEFCAGKIVFVLEGGYGPVEVANGVLSVFKALMKESFIDPGDSSPHQEPEVGETLRAVCAFHGF